MRTSHVIITAAALGMMSCHAFGQTPNLTTDPDTIAQVCEQHGFKHDTALFASCYQAEFARRIALVNLAVDTAAKRGGDNSVQPSLYGYIMPDGKLVVCDLSPTGITTGCNPKNLQLVGQ